MDEGGILKRLKRARVLFSCSVIVILIIAGLFVYERKERVEGIDSVQNSIQSELNVAKENYERIRGQYDEIRSQKNEIQLELDLMQPELNFWQDCAVIVTECGEKYHTYGCQYVDGHTFWIYNVELAIYRGYEPCSVCDPPRM